MVGLVFLLSIPVSVLLDCGSNGQLDHITIGGYRSLTVRSDVSMYFTELYAKAM